MRSIRRDLTLTLLFSLTLLIAAGSAGLYGLFRYILIRDEDSTLASKAHALATLVHQRPTGTIELEFSDDFMREFQGGRESEFFEIWLDGDHVLARSRSLKEVDLPRHSVSSKELRNYNMDLPDGRRGRAAIMEFLPKPDPDDYALAHLPLPAPDAKSRAVVVVARGTETMNHLLSQLAFSLIAISLIVPLGIALVVRWIVRRGLSPLENVGAAAAAISAEKLDYRYGVQTMPEELQPICARLNDLLERIEGAFERQRRFNGDVAHELRTPIAELRTLAEVSLMEGAEAESPETMRQTLRETLQVSAKMERMVATLLTLARAEAGRQPVAWRSFDLSSELERCWAGHADRAQQRDLSVEWKVAGKKLTARTDSTMLRSIIENLFTNAVDHTPQGGRIRIEASQQGTTIRLRIANTNPGLKGDDLTRMREPFWQKDPSRSDENHSGLGMALVSAICKALQTPLAIEIDDAGDFAITLEMRAAPADSAD